MARRNKHTLLYVAGAGVGAWVAYQYLYKPWAAARAAAADTGGGGLIPSVYPAYPPFTNPLPAPGAVVAAPGAIPPPIGFTSLGPQYGGVLGACIAKKGGTWSPQKCQERLDKLTNDTRNAQAQIAALRGATAGVDLTAARDALARTQAALNAATAGYNADLQAGDTAGAANWHAAIVSHTADLNDLNSRIAAGSRANDNSGAIAAWQGAIAAHDSDYFDLTGQHLVAA